RSRGFEDDPRRGLRIDLILTTQALHDRVIDCGVDYEIRGMEKPSDHCPVWLALRWNPQARRTQRLSHDGHATDLVSRLPSIERVRHWQFPFQSATSGVERFPCCCWVSCATAFPAWPSAQPQPPIVPC